MTRSFTCFFMLLTFSSFGQDSITTDSSEQVNLEFSLGLPITTQAYSKNIQSIDRSIDYLIDNRIGWMKRRDGKQKFLKGTVRFLRYAFIDFPISTNIILFNHEVVGHLTTVVNSGFTPTSYYQPIYYYGFPISTIYLNFDKNVDSTSNDPAAYVKFSLNSNYNYYYPQLTNLFASGVMAENVYRSNCQEDWLDRKLVPYSDATTYILSMRDNRVYLKTADEHSIDGDINAYLYYLNLSYNPSLDQYSHDSIKPFIDENFKIKGADLGKANILSNLCDPNLYFSFLAVGNYIFKGKSYTKLPLLRLGKIQIMPALSLVLAPFGLEYNLRTPLVFPRQKMQLQFRYGEAYSTNYYGIGLKLIDLQLKNSTYISPHIEFFSQPSMYYGNSKSSNELYRKIGGNGFLAEIEIQKKFPTVSSLYLNARIGYKTSGFVLGESLKATPIIQFGFGTLLSSRHK